MGITSSEHLQVGKPCIRKEVVSQSGFTLLELVVAMVLAAVVSTGIYNIYNRQQQLHNKQEQLTDTQQNLRSAMYYLNKDIRMAGYFTNLIDNTVTLDWDNMDSDTETIFPMIYARNNVTSHPDGPTTDLIVIIKASEAVVRPLSVTESAAGSTITLDSRDLDGDGQSDLHHIDHPYGILARWDMTGADFFQVNNASGNPSLTTSLNHVYAENDWIFRADVIIYEVKSTDPGTAQNPVLVRHNLGTNQLNQVVAENIENLQFRYEMAGAPVTDDPSGNEEDVRAVEIQILARTKHQTKGHEDTKIYRMGGGNYTSSDEFRRFHRRILRSTVETRNIGL